jgi:ketosteroid isomerase-like protein
VLLTSPRNSTGHAGDLAYGDVVTIDSAVLVVSAAWDAALVSNDAEAVAAFMADDWAYVGPTGAVPKADVVGWIASGQLAHHTMETIGDAHVAVYGDSAIVTARKQSSGAGNGVSYTADEWISEVFVRNDGRWLCVLSHECPVQV